MSAKQNPHNNSNDDNKLKKLSKYMINIIY